MEIFISSSWLLATLLLLLSSIFLYTLISKKSSTSVPNKLLPNPPKLPIIGNLHHLVGKSSRHQTLWQLSNRYGPVMLFYIGSKPFLIISNSAMAKQVLKTQDHLCCSRTVFKATKRLTYNHSDIAFSPYNNHWREMRKILASEFLGPKRVKLFNHVLVTEIETMLHSLSPNTEVNLSNVFLAIVKTVVFFLAFGKNYREKLLKKGPTLELMLDKTMELLNGSVGDSFPWLGQVLDRFSGWNGRVEKCFSNLDAYIVAIINEHENHTTNDISDDEKDFVHMILELSSKGDASNYQLTKQDIKALVMDILMGGIGTTVATLVWAMSEIVKNGRVMQKLQNEIRKCTERIEKVKEMDITKMKYLKMVVKETLRLHPPAPLLIPHETISECRIGGYNVFPKTTVLINGWAIGRDPNTWGDDAAEFYPERFDNDDEINYDHNLDMIPFGGGRRSCPAIKTAPATVELVIANLVYWFDWEVINNESLNMEEEGSLVARKKFPLLLVPTKHIQ